VYHEYFGVSVKQLPTYFETVASAVICTFYYISQLCVSTTKVNCWNYMHYYTPETVKWEAFPNPAVQWFQRQTHNSSPSVMEWRFYTLNISLPDSHRKGNNHVTAEVVSLAWSCRHFQYNRWNSMSADCMYVTIWIGHLAASITTRDCQAFNWL
jgi:hypothetical protein